MRTISVIIPVYNDPVGIKTTLRSVCEQTDDNYEVIPVDNNSTDTTPDIIQEFEQRFPDIINAQKETDVQSSYAARNTGIENAVGDILLFIDSDMWVDSTWVSDVRQTLQKTNCEYLGWNIELVAESDGGPEPPLVSYERMVSFAIKSYIEKQNFTPTCGLAVKKSVIDTVGDFDERLISGGDKEFGQRVHRAGFKQCYTDNVTSYHPVRETWKEKKKQAIRIGRGHAQLYRFHSEAEPIHPLHPVRYAPPNPFVLRNQADVKISVTDFSKLYIIAWVLKMMEVYGLLSEYIFDKSVHN